MISKLLLIFKPRPQNRILVPLRGSFQNFWWGPLSFLIWESPPPRPQVSLVFPGSLMQSLGILMWQLPELFWLSLIGYFKVPLRFLPTVYDLKITWEWLPWEQDLHAESLGLYKHKVLVCLSTLGNRFSQFLLFSPSLTISSFSSFSGGFYESDDHTCENLTTWAVTSHTSARWVFFSKTEWLFLYCCKALKPW